MITIAEALPWFSVISLVVGIIVGTIWGLVLPKTR